MGLIKYIIVHSDGHAEVKQYNSKETNLFSVATKELKDVHLDTLIPCLPSKFKMVYCDGEEDTYNKVASSLMNIDEYGNAIIIKTNRKYKTHGNYNGVKSLSKKDIKNLVELLEYIKNHE